MKNKNALRAMNAIDDKYLEEAESGRKSAGFGYKKPLIAFLCTILLVVGITVFPQQKKSVMNPIAFAIEPNVDNTKNYNFSDYADIARNITKMDAEALRVLADQDGKNVLYSPLNIYLATGMLAEISGTSTQKEVLDFLGFSNLQELEDQIYILWNDLNTGNPENKLVLSLANSVWLNQDKEINKDPLQRLADYQFASSYAGKMGSEEMNQKIRDWINDKTNGLLKDAVKDIKLKEDTVMALISALYMKDSWRDVFDANINTVEVFHAPSGDVETQMMHSGETGSIFIGTKFTAFQKMMSGTSMLFVLPKEGYTVNDLADDEEVRQLLEDPYAIPQKFGIIHLSVPKFDVTGKLNLRDILEKMGLAEMFGPEADFTPLIRTGGYVSKATHDCRIKVDETGVEGAAYTMYVVADGMMADPDEYWLTLDRPFLYSVSTFGGVHLFTGILQNPAE